MRRDIASARGLKLWVWAIAVLLASAGLARGQATEPTAKGSGSAQLSAPADHLLLAVQLKVHGKDVKEAMANLQELESSIRKKLADFPEGTIEFDPAHMDSEDSPQKAYARMMANAMNPGAHHKPALVQGVNLLATLYGSWPLKGDGADAIVTQAYELQEKLKASSPWKSTDKPATPEQEEEAEENAAVSVNNPWAAAAPKPGQPAFSFSATFTPEQRAKASGEAFARARAQAAGLARAAGKALDELRSIDSQAGPAPSADSSNEMAQYIAAMQGLGSSASKARPSAPDSTTGDEPGAVRELISVTATFTAR